MRIIRGDKAIARAAQRARTSSPPCLQELMGEVFAFDKYTHTLVLKELAPSTTIRIINSDMIKSPGVSSPGFAALKRP